MSDCRRRRAGTGAAAAGARVSRRGSVVVLLLVAALAGSLAACELPFHPAGDDPPAADLQVLFIGNSLTAANDLPGLVRTIAEATGESFAARSVIVPGFSLEDHWSRGDALRVIREGWADVVVMQQGPSSLARNQRHLREWTARFAGEIRSAGGRPMLYMVWPSRARSAAFDAVSESYSTAADSAGALLAPAGEAWRAVWRRSPELRLYGSDGFHPNGLGSVVAALTIYRVLYDRSVAELPDTLAPISADLPTIRLVPEISEIVYPSVEEASVEFGRSSTAPTP